VKTEEFGPWLARQLRRQGMSQQEMADKVAVTRAAVSAWVTGRALPRPEAVQLIAEALGVEPLSLYSLEEDPLPASALTWYHRPAHVDGGREYGNAAAFAFEPSLSALVREATQNSLDERVDRRQPVRVRFSVHEITGDRYFDFLETIRWGSLEEHFAAAARLRQKKVGHKLSAALEVMRDQSRLTLLRIDDYNASGLTGDDFDDKGGDNRFAAVMRRQLDSFKTGAAAGGSFGLGKATLWASSGLGLVFANSKLSTPFEGKTDRRVIGRLDLPWRQLPDGTGFAGPAWFGEPSASHDGATRSWWADEGAVDKLYLARDSASSGTSFLIVGVPDTILDSPPDESSNGDRGSDAARLTVLRAIHDELVSMLSENFWAAMVGGGGVAPILEASVTTLRNGSIVVPEERVRPERWQPARTRALRAFFEGTTVSEPSSTEDVLVRHVPLTVPPRRDEGDGRNKAVTHQAVLLLTQASDSSEDQKAADQLVYMRGTRMQIQSRSIREALATAKYAGVLLAGHAADDSAEADAAEAFLRAAEPPEHNAWKKTDDLVAEYARGAAARLAEFNRAVAEAVREITRRRDTAADEEGPALLRQLLTLNAPAAPKAPGYPTVKRMDGRVDEAGAWMIEVEVRLPVRPDSWRLRPILKFVTQSGPHLPADWARLEAVARCALGKDPQTVVCRGDARSAVLRGFSEISSHPVAARMSRATVEIVAAKGDHE
jgi:RNA polymerase primary sigma factor